MYATKTTQWTESINFRADFVAKSTASSASDEN